MMKKVTVLFLMLAVSCIPLCAQTSSAESTLEKEKIRRQELAVKAQKQIQEARALVLEGKIKEAKDALDKALDKVPNVGEGKALYDAANGIRADITLISARKALDKKDWVEAKEKAEEALGYQADNEEAKKILDESMEVLSLGMKDGKQNPVLSKTFIRRINRVNELIKQGKDKVATGQYDEAEKLFKEAMATDPDPEKSNDPYNKAAAQELVNLQKIKRQSAEMARKSFEVKKMNEVRELWHENARVQQIKISDDSEGSRSNPTPMSKGGAYDLQQKLRTIRIPEIDFQQATIQDAANFLTARSRENDSSRAGVSFLLREDALSKAQPISLSLRDVPLGEALRYITQLANVKFRVEDQSVLIVPLNAPTGVLIVREFTVRSSFMKVGGAANADEDKDKLRSRRGGLGDTDVQTEEETAQKALMARGVRFDEGATASYSAITGRLIVKNTQDQIDLIEELILADMADQGIKRMVRIDSKFIEINQTDLDSLSTNWQLRDGVPFTGYYPGRTGSRFSFGTSSAQTQNATTATLPQSSIDNMIGNKPTEATTASTRPNILSVRALLDNVGVSALLEAINQKKSTNLVTAPTIVVNPGVKGTIQVAREFVYPISWDSPKITFPTQDDKGKTTGIQSTVPAWPTEFSQPTKVGMSISVTPSVDPNNQKISLDLNPNIVDFDGFIDYGSTIAGGVDESVTPHVPNIVVSTYPIAGSNNKIQVPVFTARTYDNIKLDVRDGYTMIVGGLMREDIQSIEDKIPVLGDIPIVGRAFRSKVEKSVRKNSLLFVTPRILGPNGQPLNPFAGEDSRVSAN